MHEEAFLIKIKSLVDKNAPTKPTYGTAWEKFGVSKDEFDRLAKEARLNPFKNEFDRLTCKECGMPMGKHYGESLYDVKCDTIEKAPTPFSPNAVKMVIKSKDTGREREMGTYQNTALAMNHLNILKKTHPKDTFTVISEEAMSVNEEQFTVWIFKTENPTTNKKYVLHIENQKGEVVKQGNYFTVADAKAMAYGFKRAKQGATLKIMEKLEMDIKLTLEKTAEEAKQQQLHEMYIHDQIKKAMKKIWKAIGSPDMPKMQIPEFMANIDLFTVKKILGANNELIPYFDNLDHSSKISLAREVFV